MQAAWRLATSNLSARRSRSALLIGAVTLSAALIAAVACAIASANGAIRDQLEGQIGAAELRIRPSNAGNTFPIGILEKAQAWPETAYALPKARDAISVRISLPILEPGENGAWTRTDHVYTTDAMANGVDLAREFKARPLKLVTGRLPAKRGEVVIDAQLAERLSWSYNYAREVKGEFNHAGTETGYLNDSEPTIPDAAPEAQALAINAAVGIRSGSHVSVLRLFRTPVSFEQLENKFGISRDMLTNVMKLFRSVTTLEVVGVAEPPPLGGSPQAYMGLDTFYLITGRPGVVDEVEIHLKPGLDPETVAERHRDEFDDTLSLQTTEKVTSGLEKNLASTNIGFTLASLLAMLSAAFIIMTGLTTGIAEQQRGLAIIRCIGGTKSQLAQSQLLTGLIVGGIGAAIGVPLGVAFAAITVDVYHEHLPTGLRIPAAMLVLAGAGTIAAGLVGAAYPAWIVSRMSPLRALTNRSAPIKPRQIWWVLAFALTGLAIQALIVSLSPNGDTLFWLYATTGLPAMFVGYFLLSVPVTVVVVRVIAEPLSVLLRLPPRVLGRTVAATPYRHGFTAGAMMAGLALMIAIWTNGGAILRDWLARIEFPDAFVNGFRLPVEAQDKLETLPFVLDTCAITIVPVRTTAFGVSGLATYNTSFIAFQPDEFFGMTHVEFLQGDEQTALQRLNEGGAVIVGREFNVAQGLGVGDTFTCEYNGKPFDFEIVGVVTSPGLELASKFFNIGEEYIDQSIHAVFGSRRDMIEKFGNDNIQLIQIKLAPDADSDEAMRKIRDALYGFGILDAGSGKRIKHEIEVFINGSLVVFSGVAVASMLVACLGVANLIVAGIEARRFEFGVLRAVGAQPSLLTRLVLGEAVIIALTACLVGTAMGVQGAWAGQRIYRFLVGLLMHIRLPVGPTMVGWAAVFFFTLGAALPAIIRLNRQRTRELLAATKG
ncbi:MAG: ABC transporter permease [Phycisphaeraceae bacterium]|nr:MAG: ABC transporter permease [Phycisphaeraceae bacterium]